MHRYSINSRKREEVVGKVAILSLVIGVIIAVIKVTLSELDIFKTQAESITCILMVQATVALCPITLYGVLMYSYKNFIWKKVLFYHQIPDLNGVWEGKLESNLKDSARKLCIEIKQNWEDIKINTYTDTESKATSTLAEIKVDDIGRVYLSYAFENIRVKDSYIGFNCLQYKDDELFGEYFTNKTMGKEICKSLGIYESQIQELIATGMGSKGTLRVKRKAV